MARDLLQQAARLRKAISTVGHCLQMYETISMPNLRTNRDCCVAAGGGECTLHADGGADLTRAAAVRFARDRAAPQAARIRGRADRRDLRGFGVS